VTFIGQGCIGHSDQFTDFSFQIVVKNIKCPYGQNAVWLNGTQENIRAVGRKQDSLAVAHIDYGRIQVVVNIGGIGFKIYCTSETKEIAKENEKISLFTHLVVKEDALDLYGFITKDELNGLNLGRTFSDSDVPDIAEMSNSKNKKLLYEIGTAAAEKEVKTEHLTTYNL
jgi:hypothetical protein